MILSSRRSYSTEWELSITINCNKGERYDLEIKNIEVCKELKMRKCQLTCIAEDCPVIELNNQYLEIVEKFCYLGNTIEAEWAQLTIL